MKSQSGQVLLITIMLLATVLTVVMSVTFKSTSDTQIAKLEEENQKALAAAEAAIDVALKSHSTVTLESLGNISGFTGEATLEEAPNTVFTTPLLQNDQEYTVYLAPYNNDPAVKDFAGASTSQDLTICWRDSSTAAIALEMTLIKDDGVNPATVKRYAVNPKGTTVIQNGGTDLETCSANGAFRSSYKILAGDIGNDAKLLVVRVISDGSANTKLLFKPDGGGTIPPQGASIVSEAKSVTGVTTKIRLFQSYPQIPSEFFITSF